MKALSGVKLAQVSSLPGAASSYPGQAFEMESRIYYSDGASWIPIFESLTNTFPNFHGFGMVSPRTLQQSNLNVGAGITNLGGPASGKRWMVMGALLANNSGASITSQFNLKVGTAYSVWIGTTSLVPNNSNVSLSLAMPILEAGDQLAIVSSGSGLRVFFWVLEFSDISPLRSVKKVGGWSVGYNTLYTCPTGYISIMQALTTGASGNVYVSGGLVLWNFTGTTRSYYYNFVPNGESSQAIGTNSNCLTGSVRTATTGTQFAGIICPPFFAAGDSLTLNTDSSADGQNFFMTVMEIPLYA